MNDLVSGWYMASTSRVDEKYDSTIGVIHTMNQGKYRKRLERCVPWCLDNGVFTNKFEVHSWLRKLDIFKEYKNTCIFVTIPDVIKDCSATLSQFGHYRELVKDFPVALVSQDGIRNQKDKIPWSEFDCLFVGGSNEHKLGDEGRWIIEEAKSRDKWIHVGRVNSKKRMNLFWDADSWDGTTLSFDPSKVMKFHEYVLSIREKKRNP